MGSGFLLNASHEERVLGGPKKQFVCPNECQKCCMMEENMGEWQCLVKKIFAGATAFLQRMAGYNCGDPEFFGPKETVITCRYESQTVDFAGDLEKFTADRKVLRRELKAVIPGRAGQGGRVLGGGARRRRGRPGARPRRGER